RRVRQRRRPATIARHAAGDLPQGRLIALPVRIVKYDQTAGDEAIPRALEAGDARAAVDDDEIVWRGAVGDAVDIGREIAILVAAAPGRRARGTARANRLDDAQLDVRQREHRRRDLREPDVVLDRNDARRAPRKPDRARAAPVFEHSHVAVARGDPA